MCPTLSPPPSDLSRADVTQGAQVKQEVVVGEGRLRVWYAAVVTLTTKRMTGCDLSMSFLLQECLYKRINTKKKKHNRHYSHMSSEEGRDRILHS